jgi:hypothetical protein
MEEVIKKYFLCWIEKDIEVLKEVFSDDIRYSECYGPEYQGLEQVIRWFRDWNEKGTVRRWDIKQILTCAETLIAEWYFECDYEDNIGGFDGITLAKFDNKGLICELKEFQSKSEHYLPYN